MKQILDYLKENKKHQLEELKELLAIESISAQTEHNEDIQKAANWLRDHLKAIGMQHCNVMKTEGHPVVYAEWMNAKDKPTILIYGHYDVQSPDPINEWKTDPFRAEVKSGNLYGRGTADDKGQLFTHIKAIEALIKTEGKLPVNIKMLIEGEEEIGGPNLEEFIKKNKKLLSANVCLISDSHAASPTMPLLEYGLRGIVYAQLSLQTMPKDAHSGSYGGNIPNPANELAILISKMKDEKTQKIKIPGFYDNVRKLSIKERLSLKKSTFNEDSVIEETGVEKSVGEKGFSEAERAGARPTLDVNGIWSGYTNEGPKTIIPSKAEAKISMRIVPNQTVSEISYKFTNFVKKNTPDYADIRIEIISSGEPLLMEKDNEYFKNAEKAMKDVFGNKPKYELQGGSIPVTASIKDILGMDSILMGFGLPDDGLHAPNEKMNLSMFYKGIECSARFFKSFE